MKELFDYISSSIDLDSETQKHLLSISQLKKVKKGTILLSQGQKINKTFFVIKGCARSFAIDETGKDHTLQFATKNWWISDFIAMYSHEYSTLNIECITDSSIIEINTSEIDKIYKLCPSLESFQRKNLERHIVNLHKRILNQLQLSAYERYLIFLKQYPEIEKHAQNYHIASYLGITQQSLSRVRSKKINLG